MEHKYFDAESNCKHVKGNNKRFLTSWLMYTISIISFLVVCLLFSFLSNIQLQKEITIDVEVTDNVKNTSLKREVDASMHSLKEELQYLRKELNETKTRADYIIQSLQDKLNDLSYINGSMTANPISLFSVSFRL